MTKTLPLYEGAQKAARDASKTSSMNLGLYHQKFFNRWDNWESPKLDTKRQMTESAKGEWLADVAAHTAGESAHIQEFMKRRARLLRYGGAAFHAGCFKTRWHFVTGTGYQNPVENGFAWHHTLGTPYVPGSGVKGLVRAWAAEWAGAQEEDLARVFGPADRSEQSSVGSIIFLDAIPTQAVTLKADVLTPHYTEWYQKGEPPADWHSPTPSPFLVVAKEQEFFFSVMARTPAAASDLELAWTWLCDALDLMGAGAKTAAGYGFFERCNELGDDSSWFEELSFDPATLSQEELIARQMDAWSEQEALEYVREHREDAQPLAEDVELWREALASRFGPLWSRGESEQVSAKKLQEDYLPWLLGDEQQANEDTFFTDRPVLLELQEHMEAHDGVPDKTLLRAACEQMRGDDSWSVDELTWMRARVIEYQASKKKLKKKDQKWVDAALSHIGNT